MIFELFPIIQLWDRFFGMEELAVPAGRITRCFVSCQVTKPSAQIGFIRFVLIPLFEALEELFPVLEVM